MRSVSSATCTSAEPVSESWRRCSVIVAVLSGMRVQNLLAAERYGSTRRGPSRVPDTGRDATGRRRRSARGSRRVGLDVALHLGDQGVDGVEALLAPEPLDEADLRPRWP